jgi:hypothetical protein
MATSSPAFSHQCCRLRTQRITLTFVDNSTIQFDGDRAADDLAEKSRRISALALSHHSVLHDEFELIVAQQWFLYDSEIYALGTTESTR